MNIGDLSQSFTDFALFLRGENDGIKEDISQNTADIAQLRIDVGNLPTGGGGTGGAVDSVNGMTGIVTLDAASVGALPNTYTPLPQSWDEVTDKPATFAPSSHTHDGVDLSGVVKTVNGQAPDLLGDISVSADSPVDSVNGATGTVVLTAADVGALPSSYVAPDQSWEQITGKPTTFAPTAHSHTQSEVTGLTDALSDKVTGVGVSSIEVVTQSAYDAMPTPRPADVVYITVAG